MEFTNTEDMNKYIESVLDRVILEVTDKILDIFTEYVINRAYINHSASGKISDLYNRDYVGYYNGTGTPTFEFLNAFKMIKDNVENYTINLMFDESEMTTSNNQAYTIKGSDLLEFLEDGKNYNVGGFIEELDVWLIENYDSLIRETLKKYGLDIT